MNILPNIYSVQFTALIAHNEDRGRAAGRASLRRHLTTHRTALEEMAAARHLPNDGSKEETNGE
jgi:hypothetical protein